MPSIPYPGLIGPAYTNISISVSGDQCINLFPELVESGHGKNNIFLMGTAGLKLLGTLPDQPVRGIWAGAGRLFAVAGAGVFEVFPDFTYKLIATINRSDTTAQIFANGNQLFIVSDGQGYTTTADQTGITGVQAVIPATTGEYLDTYFVAQTPNSTQFQLSKSLDGLTWDPLNFASKESDAFKIISMLTDHQLLILFGERSTEFWMDSGNPDFPLQRAPGGVIEQGCGSTFSPARIGEGTIAWQGYDSRGEGIIWKATNYSPQRISNHCVETALQGYRKAGCRLDNTVGVPKQMGGHQFYELHIPDANKGKGATWVYDDTASMQLGSPQWHERLGWKDGDWTRHPAMMHAYVFGKHIVGDVKSGNLYEESFDYFDLAGEPLRSLRSSPHIHDHGLMVFYGALWLDMLVGEECHLVDGNGKPRAPQVMRQISDDGGFSWGNEKWATLGKTGQKKARARWTRGGRARDRCDRFVITDPVRRVLINCQMDVEEGTA